MLHCRIAAHAFTTDGRQCQEKIKTLDITMDMPTADMDLNAGEELALKSVQTAYGDLFKSGVISLMSISLGRRVWREQR